MHGMQRPLTKIRVERGEKPDMKDLCLRSESQSLISQIAQSTRFSPRFEMGTGPDVNMWRCHAVEGSLLVHNPVVRL